MRTDFQLPISNCRFENAPRARRVSSHSSFGFRHSGFTFIEVLFAVILLGIGFIMIAAVFPVAIQQTSAVSNETQGTAVEQDAVKKIQALADATIPPNATYGLTNSFFQPTLVQRTAGGGVVPVVCGFSYGMTQALGTDAFFSTDKRYAWVGFYRRDSFNSPFAQVYIISLQNPNFATYTTAFAPGSANSSTPINPAPPILPSVAPPIPPLTYNYSTNPIPNSTVPGAANSIYTPVYSPNAAGIAYNGVAAVAPPLIAGSSGILSIDVTTGNAQITFASPLPTNIVTGAYVLIADDGTKGTAGNPPPAPLLTGRFLRLGTLKSDGVTFTLQPGYDVTATELTQLTGTNNGTGVVDVFIIGAAPTSDGAGGYTGPFTGPNQDIGVASGFVRVNTTNN